MNPSSPSSKRTGLVLFFTGVFLAFSLTALMVWADIEAVSYGFPRLGNDPVRGLWCPPLMNSTEISKSTLTLRNTTERALRPRVQIMVSETGTTRWRSMMTSVEMEPGERKTVSWDVSANDVVLRSFVFTKVYTFAGYPQPNVEGSCGIFVVSIPWIRGDLLYRLWLGASLVFLAAGLWLSDFRKVQAIQSSGSGFPRKVLAVLSLFGLTAGSVGWWPVGVIVLLVIALTSLVVLLMGQSS